MQNLFNAEFQWLWTLGLGLALFFPVRHVIWALSVRRADNKGGNIDENPIQLTGEDILKLIVDRGSNDIAYIIYKREATIDLIDLNSFEINSNKPGKECNQIYDEKKRFPSHFGRL